LTTGKFAGVYPIVATPFDDQENVDFASLERLVEKLLAAGSTGLVLLANASEGYALTEAEKDAIVTATIDQVQRRVPVVVTVNEFSVRAAVTRAQRAAASGADAIMCMPPFFGGWKADQAGIKEFFVAMGDGVGLPLILQDHPLSGIDLNVNFLYDLLEKVPAIRYIKTEVPNAPRKVRAILSSIGPARVDVFGGMSGVLFPAELEVEFVAPCRRHVIRMC
jgi:dihydrodipicolinate synthase/N-acetylneuraminate lyase